MAGVDADSLWWRAANELNALLDIPLQARGARLQKLLLIGIQETQRVIGMLGPRWLKRSDQHAVITQAKGAQY